MTDVFPSENTALDAPSTDTPVDTENTESSSTVAPPVGAESPLQPTGAVTPEEATEEQSIRDLLSSIAKEQASHRAEVAALREELNNQKQPATTTVAPSATEQSPEALAEARANEVSEHDYYCPGCGKLVDYRQQCQGTPEKPHPPIEVVSTDELKQDDPSKHTAPVYVS